MVMKRKLFSFAVVAAAAAMSLGMTAFATEEDYGEPNGGEEIELWHYFEGEADALNALCKAYNESQSEIYVVPTFMSREELMKQYTIGAVSGELPDIGMVDSPDMASYISLGVFEDITDQLEAWGELDNFYEGPLSSCMDSDGNLYGLPNNSNCLAILCNMDMLRAAGFDEPPTTLEEFMAVAEACTDPDNGVYGFAMSAIGNEEGTFQFIPWLYSAGGTVADISSDESIAAFQTLGTMIENGWMSKEAVNWGQGDALNAWAAGKAAMLESGTWQIALSLDGDLKDTVTWEYAYVAMPISDNGAQASVIGGENFGVCTGAKNVEACVDFLEYMETAQANADWCEIAGKLPVRADAVELKDFWTADERYAVFNESMNFAVARGPHAEWPTISEAIYTAEQAVLLGEKDAATAAADAAAVIDPILAENPLPTTD
jgi:multiple sugar transport system substrate-binding protein